MERARTDIAHVSALANAEVEMPGKPNITKKKKTKQKLHSESSFAGLKLKEKEIENNSHETNKQIECLKICQQNNQSKISVSTH